MYTIYYLILVPMVYLAAAVFVLGTAVRLVKLFTGPQQATSLQIYPARKPALLFALSDTFLFPTVRRHKPVLWVFLVLFHLCLLLLIIGHLELLAEFDFLQIIPHEPFLGGGFVGLCAAICLLFFLLRRLQSPVKELSVPEDYYLLILLFLIVIFGSELDWARRWYYYEELMVDDYRAYLMSLLMLRPELPAAVTDSGHGFMLVLHVFFANLFLLIFPFTHTLHTFLALPANRLRRGK